jgi:hypothetical protein
MQQRQQPPPGVANRWCDDCAVGHVHHAKCWFPCGTPSERSGLTKEGGYWLLVASNGMSSAGNGSSFSATVKPDPGIPYPVLHHVFQNGPVRSPPERTPPPTIYCKSLSANRNMSPPHTTPQPPTATQLYVGLTLTGGVTARRPRGQILAARPTHARSTAVPSHRPDRNTPRAG